jgi:ubiquinone/menaquinone biosynthesis C-methylase UbiE
MGALAAHFFRYIQDADFYRELHREAVELLPPGKGKAWFDVGCGPGLVARLAQDHGYAAVGYDVDDDMIRLARRQSCGKAGPQFQKVGLEDLAKRYGRADVVSAASLLSVLRDREAAFSQLMDIVAPGGTLLIIETSERMASRGALASSLKSRAEGKRAWVLRLWAHVRRGNTAVDVEALCRPGCTVTRHELLDGLVNAWIVHL